MKRHAGKKVVSFLLGTILTVTTISTGVLGRLPLIGEQLQPMTVQADSGDKAINVGYKPLAKGAGNDNAQILRFGATNWWTLPWHVVANSPDYANNCLVFLATDNLGSTVFNSKGGNDYNNSDLQATFDSLAPEIFTDREIAGITKRKGILKNEEPVLWAMSFDELKVLANSLLCSPPAAAIQSPWWWTRSAGTKSGLVNYVFCEGGAINIPGADPKGSMGYRPSFLINYDSIALTSSASGGKGDGTVGPDALKPVGTNTDNEWKVTLYDYLGEHAGFDVDVTSVSGNVINISYSGAATGDNEYISAVLVNGDGDATYYGHIAKPESSSGTATFNLPDGNTDLVYVFNEQCNGELKTDYASKMFNLGTSQTEITLTGPDSQEVLQYYSDFTVPFTVNGVPAPTVTMEVSPDAGDKITWDSYHNEIQVKAGAPCEDYQCTLTASNGVLPDVTRVYTLHVLGLSFEYDDKFNIPAGVAGTPITPIHLKDGVRGNYEEFWFNDGYGTWHPAWLNISSDGVVTGTRPNEAREAVNWSLELGDYTDSGHLRSTKLTFTCGEIVEKEEDLPKTLDETSKNEEGTDPKKNDQEDEAEHEHTYEWVTAQEATETEDGYMAYQCSECGRVEYKVPIDAYYIFNKNTAEKIRNATAGKPVKIETPLYISFHEMVKDAIVANPNAEVIVDYNYMGKSYEMTIPAGTTGQQLDILWNGTKFCGFRNMASIFPTVEK